MTAKNDVCRVDSLIEALEPCDKKLQVLASVIGEDGLPTQSFWIRQVSVMNDGIGGPLGTFVSIELTPRGIVVTHDKTHECN